MVQSCSAAVLAEKIMTEKSDNAALILLISHMQAARQQQKDGGSGLFVWPALHVTMD